MFGAAAFAAFVLRFCAPGWFLLVVTSAWGCVSAAPCRRACARGRSRSSRLALCTGGPRASPSAAPTGSQQLPAAAAVLPEAPGKEPASWGGCGPACWGCSAPSIPAQPPLLGGCAGGVATRSLFVCLTVVSGTSTEGCRTLCVCSWWSQEWRPAASSAPLLTDARTRTVAGVARPCVLAPLALCLTLPSITGRLLLCLWQLGCINRTQQTAGADAVCNHLTFLLSLPLPAPQAP